VPKYVHGRRRCRTWEGASATKGAPPSANLSSAHGPRRLATASTGGRVAAARGRGRVGTPRPAREREEEAARSAGRNPTGQTVSAAGGGGCAKSQRERTVLWVWVCPAPKRLWSRGLGCI
jgi:hypothetical protein